MPFYQELGDWEKMKFRKGVILFVALLNLFAAVLIISFGASAWQEVKTLVGGDTKLEITVTGEGKVTAKPDIAKVDVTIVTEKESLTDAQAENSKKSQAVVNYIKSAGVQEKDIKTTGYNIYPQYSSPRPVPCVGVQQSSGSSDSSAIIFPPCLENTPPPPHITSYQIRASYQIIIRDIGKAGVILAGLVSAGANEVSGITFTIDKPDNPKAEARLEALRDARTKADTLAKNLQLHVGKIMSFTEGGSFPQPIYLSREAALGKGGGGETAPAPSVQPGENEVVVDVSITYEFR